MHAFPIGGNRLRVFIRFQKDSQDPFFLFFSSGMPRPHSVCGVLCERERSQALCFFFLLLLMTEDQLLKLCCIVCKYHTMQH